MRDRCHRCHITLTSEDKYHYGHQCEECQIDDHYEEYERGRIKSAYWRWRAVYFCMRWLFCSIAGYRSLRMHFMSRPVAADRPKFQRYWRK